MAVFEAIVVFYLVFCLVGMFFKAIPMVLLLPVAPFLTAKEIKYTRPIWAWFIIISWALVYLLLIVLLVADMVS